MQSEDRNHFFKCQVKSGFNYGIFKADSVIEIALHFNLRKGQRGGEHGLLDKTFGAAGSAEGEGCFL